MSTWKEVDTIPTKTSCCPNQATLHQVSFLYQKLQAVINVLTI